jgi:hypothetical protein
MFQPLVRYLQRLAVVASSVACLADDVDWGKKVHLDLDQAIALTFLAATALHIETKAPDAVAAYLRRRELGKQIAEYD